MKLAVARFTTGMVGGAGVGGVGGVTVGADVVDGVGGGDVAVEVDNYAGRSIGCLGRVVGVGLFGLRHFAALSGWGWEL